MQWTVSFFAIVRKASFRSCLSHSSLLLNASVSPQERHKTSLVKREPWTARQLGAPLLRDPIFVYNNWSAYDELSDNIPLTEELTMKELNEILRLRRLGVRFDYYTIDAFWFDPDGGYRTGASPTGPTDRTHGSANASPTAFCRASGSARTRW